MQATALWSGWNRSSFQNETVFESTADLKHYTARFRILGEGDPIVLIPGLAGGIDLVGPLAETLARTHRVITYQLRGEDDCFALRQRFGIRELVDDLAEFLDWMGLERPAILGVSFGSILGLEFAARHPRRLGALAVQGLGAKFERTLMPRIAELVLTYYPLPANNRFVNQFFNVLFGGCPDRSMFEFVTRCCWATDQSVIAHRMHLLHGLDITRRLSRIQLPTMLFNGRKDALVTKSNLNALAQGLPDLRHQIVAGHGHLAFVTQPSEIGQEIRSFLTPARSHGA